MKNVLLLLVSLTVLAAAAERPKFERYQTIVDRQPFGLPPEGFDPKNPGKSLKMTRDEERKKAEQEKLLQKEERRLKSAVRFSVINQTPAGDVFVGFTDSSDPKKGPRNYYLKVGDERDGWRVVEADPVKSTMSIAKHVEAHDDIEEQDIEISLAIGGDSSQEQPKAASAPKTRSLVQPGAGASRNSRRQARMEAERQREEAARQREEALLKREEAARQREEASKREREEEKAKAEADRQEMREKMEALAKQISAGRAQKKTDDDAEAPKDGADEK